MRLSKLRAAHLTRHLAGTTIARQGTTSIGRGIGMVMKRADGGRCEVEGAPARPRLDRPGRKAGGRVGRKDGGKEPEWVGEGDSGKAKKEESAELRDEGKTASNAAKGLGAGSLAAFGTMLKSKSIPRALAAGYAAMGTGAATAATAGRSLLKHHQADIADADADKAEGKRWGGRAKAKSKDNDHDADDGYAKGGFLSGMKKGALHREMGVPEGEKIPAKKLEKATHSDNPTLRRRAVRAETMKHWKHRASGGSVKKMGTGGLLGGNFGGLKSVVDAEDPEAQGQVQDAAAKVAMLGMNRGGSAKKKSWHR